MFRYRLPALEVNPARAGMIRCPSSTSVVTACKPRASGDDPALAKATTVEGT